MRLTGCFKMADDLGDEWWLEHKTKTLDSETTEQNGNPQKRQKSQAAKPGGKRKVDTSDVKSEVKNKKKKGSSGKEKKRERKKITDESDETLAKPGNAEDVRAMMSKVLKDRLGAEALEDLLPNAENDFYPHNVESLEPEKYLTFILTTWRTALKKSLFMKKTGSPILLIVTSSAVRAVELNREIKGFLDSRCKVAKLFAKHMKVEEQTKYLAKTNCQVGIGTPGRLLLLVKQGALQLESLVAVVLDWNWRDTKLKRMADIPEVRQDLVAFLKDHIIETLRGSPCKLALL